MGKLLVIEGLDGSGKATQTQILSEKFANRKLKFKKITYPNYESQSSSLVKLYLNGGISSDLFDVNCFAVSSFFACDHYISYLVDWKKNYDSGELILADRYVSSNAFHQMVKLPEIEWNNFLDWLIDFEFEKLGLPKQNYVIYLDMEPEISQKLIASRNNKLNQKSDLHEKNLKYLQDCRQAALFCARKFDWHVLKCFSEHKTLSIDEIAKKIENLVNSFNLK